MYKPEPHRWPAPPGLMADFKQLQSRTSVAEMLFDAGEDNTQEVKVCATWTVGIAKDNTVVACRVVSKGVMADSG